MSVMMSQITSLTIVYSNIYSKCRSKKNTKALHHWPLYGEFTGDQWILCTKDQLQGKGFHLMMSSWIYSTQNVTNSALKCTVIGTTSLTSWGQDKMVAIWQMTFQIYFIVWNLFSISNDISSKFIPNGTINNILSSVQVMAWHQPGNKPLSETMMVRSLTHLCITQPQWVYLSMLSILVWHLRHFNDLSAGLFGGNIKTNLYFLSFLIV